MHLLLHTWTQPKVARRRATAVLSGQLVARWSDYPDEMLQQLPVPLLTCQVEAKLLLSFQVSIGSLR